jgi:hypothetical protein
MREDYSRSREVGGLLVFSFGRASEEIMSAAAGNLTPLVHLVNIHDTDYFTSALEVGDVCRSY